MPVVAVIAAVALDAGVVGTAIAGGIGAISVLSAVTAIGATIGAIGAITGDKTLSMIGGGLGIVGGIGTLAFGSGALGSVGELFGSSAEGGAGAAGAADAAAVAGDVTDPGDAIIQSATDPAARAITTTDLPGAINSSSFVPEGSAAALDAGESGAVTSQTASLSSNLPPQVSAFAPSVGSAGEATPDFMKQFGKVFNVLPDGTELTDSVSGGGAGILNWAKNNQMLSYGILQAGGSLISGMTNPMTPAQIDALNAQSEVNRASAELIKRQAANLGQGLPGATVTGVPASAGGLINSKPIGTPLITGAPNAGASTTQPGATG